MKSTALRLYHKIPHALRRKRTIVYVVLLLIVWNFITRGAGNTSLIKTAPVTQGDISSDVTASGKVSSPEESIVHFAVSGKLVSLNVSEGDIVKKGQAIASIDRERYDIALRQAWQDFTAAKAVSEKVYDSLNGVSAENFDQKINRTAADATQNKAYDNIKAAERNLRDTTIYSPVDGTVVSLPVHVGEEMNVTTQVATISNIEKLEFKAEIDEADIGKVTENQPVDISLDAFPDKTIHTTVARISEKQVTTSTGATAFEVTSNLTGSMKYRLGMNGEATIITDKKDQVVKVPTEAVQDDKYVYAKRGNTYVKQNVKLGISSDTEVEVIDGLQKGDTVVISGYEEIPKKSILQKLLGQ